MAQKFNFLLGLKFKSVMKQIYQKHDYKEYGGALLLGINGTALICHGSSESRTIKNAILISKKYHAEKINDRIAEYLAASSVGREAQAGEPEETALRVTDEQAS